MVGARRGRRPPAPFCVTLVAHLTDDLLRPHARVFTKAKRRWGVFSVGIGAISAGILTVVYAAYLGEWVPDRRLLLAAGLLGALALPAAVAWRLRVSGVRAFAVLNTVVAVIFFTVLGGATDRMLARHGLAPFRAVVDLVEPDDPAPFTEAGEGLVGVLRSLSLGGGEAAEAPPPPPPPRAGGDAEPRAGLVPEALGEAAVAAGTPTPVSVAGAALQATVEEAGEGAPAEGTLSVVAGPASDGTVEVPMTLRGRAVTVEALVDGDVRAEFVFDTGAEATALTPALARRLGYDPESLADRRRFLTAGGPVEDPVVTVRSLSVGGAEVRNLEAVVCRRCPKNLLGRDFHEHFRVELDGRAGVLRLHAR